MPLKPADSRSEWRIPTPENRKPSYQKHPASVWTSISQRSRYDSKRRVRSFPWQAHINGKYRADPDVSGTRRQESVRKVSVRPGIPIEMHSLQSEFCVLAAQPSLSLKVYLFRT